MVAQEKMTKAPGESSFYESKLLTAKYYIGSVLPTIYGKIEAIRRNEKALLEITSDLLI